MSASFHDIRGEGFQRRVPADDALERLLSTLSPLRGESVATADAEGRILAAPPIPAPPPAPSRIARRNGAALRAERTFGAGVYDPVILPESQVAWVSTGEALPPDTDAVLPFGAFRRQGGMVEVLSALAPGEGVAAIGAPLKGAHDREAPRFEVAAGRALTPWLIAGLIATGVERVEAHARPRVAVVAVGAARRGPPDQITAALAAAIRRDGGLPLPVRRPAFTEEAVVQALRDAMAEDGADLIFTVGRTGSGPDDIAPPALARAGRVDAHGIAMRPGGSTALGRVGDGRMDDRPVIALPGQPTSALVSYAAFGAPALHRLSGRNPPPEPAIRRITLLARKLISEPGMLDVVPVMINDDGMAVPLGDPGQLGVAALAADGVVLIEAGGEGLPAGATVTVRSLDGPLLGDVDGEDLT